MSGALCQAVTPLHHLLSTLCCPPTPPLTLSFALLIIILLPQPFPPLRGDSWFFLRRSFLIIQLRLFVPPSAQTRLSSLSHLMFNVQGSLCVCVCVSVPPKSRPMHHISFLQTQPGDILVTLVVSERVHVLLNYRDCIPPSACVWVCAHRLCLRMFFFFFGALADALTYRHS